MSDLTSGGTSGGMVSFDPEGAPAAPEIADKGMMLSYAHIFAGLIPQPGDGGIVYVLGDADDAACLSQAWAPAAAAPAAAKANAAFLPNSPILSLVDSTALEPLSKSLVKPSISARSFNVNALEPVAITTPLILD